MIQNTNKRVEFDLADALETIAQQRLGKVGNRAGINSFNNQPSNDSSLPEQLRQRNITVNPSFSLIPKTHPAYSGQQDENIDETNEQSRQLPSTASKPKTAAEKLKLKQDKEMNSLLSKEQKKEKKKQDKQIAEEQKIANKENRKYYSTILEKGKEAKQSTLRLDKMEKLVDKGDLPIAAFYNLFRQLEDINPTHGAAAGAAAGGALGHVLGPIGSVAGAVAGGGLGALISPIGSLLRYAQRFTSPDSEEFEKLETQFLKGAKALFGAKVTQDEVKAFMRGIPTLANTDHGKRKIIESLRSANKAEELRVNAMKQIIKENKGRLPENLAIEVEDRITPELEKLAQKFLEV